MTIVTIETSAVDANRAETAGGTRHARPGVAAR
jgi:hypothetical protein